MCNVQTAETDSGVYERPHSPEERDTVQTAGQKRFMATGLRLGDRVQQGAVPDRYGGEQHKNSYLSADCPESPGPLFLGHSSEVCHFERGPGGT